MIQTLDRELSSRNNNAHRHSFIRSCSKRDKLRMNGVNSDGIPQNLTHLPMPDVSTIFYQTRSIVRTGINSTSNGSSRFSFQKTHMNHNENRPLTCGSYIPSLLSPSEDPHMHRQHIRFNTKITHTTQT
jgi:hypothetical protein